MHGLGLSKATRWVLGLLYLGMVALVYANTSGLANAWEATMIPVVEFLLVVIVSLLAWLIARLLGSGVQHQET